MKPCHQTRRVFLAGGLAGLVAGCGDGSDGRFGAAPAEQAGRPTPRGPRPRYDETSALVPDQTHDLRIEEVTVRLSADFVRTAPHNGVTKEFIVEEMQKTIVPGLMAAKPDGAYPVRAEVEVLRFNFANVAVGLVMGPKGSFATFRTTLYYTDTGDQVARPATNQATTLPRPTLLGVLAIRPAPEEVRIVARRAPDAIAIRLFGRPGQESAT